MSFEPAPRDAAAEPAGGETIIRVRGLGKCYQLYDRPFHRLLQSLIGAGRRFYREFWALRDVEFEVRRGETLGIIGRNGAGKSTLLQIIAGTLPATEGTVEIGGRVAALLELGSGFNPEFTGRENVYLNASILGLSRAQVEARMADILAFADIGEFVDQPVRSYSTGMVMRLAFAVMVHVDADVLIIDEALAVGDAFFMQKCMRWLRDFKQRGTLLFVSHDGGMVTGLCDRAIWLERGRVQQQGAAKDVMYAYVEALHRDQHGSVRKTPSARYCGPKPRRVDPRRELIDRSTLRNDIELLPFSPDAKGFGELRVRVTDVVMLDGKGAVLAWIIGGEQVALEITGVAEEHIDSLIVGFYVRDRLGQILFGDNTYLTYYEDGFAVEAGQAFRASFSFEMPRLQSGDYFVTTGIAEGTQQHHSVQQWLHEALCFRSNGCGVPAGLVGLPMQEIRLERVERE